uniref:Uncharacterized protein n=1 Tax=Anopheles farauti TaxID=69004 RepID=A0A182QCM1_9DIPT
MELGRYDQLRQLGTVGRSQRCHLLDDGRAFQRPFGCVRRRRFDDGFILFGHRFDVSGFRFGSREHLVVLRAGCVGFRCDLSDHRLQFVGFNRKIMHDGFQFFHHLYRVQQVLCRGICFFLDRIEKIRIDLMMFVMIFLLFGFIFHFFDRFRGLLHWLHGILSTLNRVFTTGNGFNRLRRSLRSFRLFRGFGRLFGAFGGTTGIRCRRFVALALGIILYGVFARIAKLPVVDARLVHLAEDGSLGADKAKAGIILAAVEDLDGRESEVTRVGMPPPGVWPLLLVRHRVRIGQLWHVVVGGWRVVLRVPMQVRLVVAFRTVVSTRVARFVVVDVVQRSLPVTTEVTVAVVIVMVLVLGVLVSTDIVIDEPDGDRDGFRELHGCRSAPCLGHLPSLADAQLLLQLLLFVLRLVLRAVACSRPTARAIGATRPTSKTSTMFATTKPIIRLVTLLLASTKCFIRGARQASIIHQTILHSGELVAVVLVVGDRPPTDGATRVLGRVATGAVT